MIFKFIKKGAGKSMRPTKWLGTEYLKENGKAIANIASNLFQLNQKKPSQANKLSYEACIKKYKLTPKQVEKRRRSAKLMSLVCSLTSLVIFFYMFFQFHLSHYMAGFICAILSSILLVYAFREHFLYFQLTRKNFQLGFKEWRRFLFKRA